MKSDDCKIFPPRTFKPPLRWFPLEFWLPCIS